jgi:hypothetical protein
MSGRPPLARIELVVGWYSKQWNIIEADETMYAHVFSEQGAAEIFSAVNIMRAQKTTEEPKDETSKD